MSIVDTSDMPPVKKRVLLLNYEYPPLGGGAANATFHIAKEFAQSGVIQLDIVTSAYDESDKVVHVGADVDVHFVNIGKKANSLHHQTGKDLLLYSWFGFWKAYQLMKKNKYDVTHAFFGVPCGFMALLLQYRFGVPYVVSLRGSDVPGYSDRFTKLYPILRSLIRFIWKKASAVVANSQGLKELALITNPHQAIAVIPNGVDTKRFCPEPFEASQENIIITTGATRITERKGLRYLLEAIWRISHDFPNILVEIMGEGSEKKNLETFVTERNLTPYVKFLGRIPAEETPRYYNRADIFVLPSFNEGMSNALLEALACGLPAIVTETGGSHELVTENQNGLYIEMKSSSSIEGALRKLLQDTELRERFGKESRRKAEANGWKQVAGQYQTLYNQITA